MKENNYFEYLKYPFLFEIFGENVKFSPKIHELNNF